MSAIRIVQSALGFVGTFAMFDGSMPGQVLPGYYPEVIFVVSMAFIALLEAVNHHDHS